MSLEIPSFQKSMRCHFEPTRSSARENARLNIFINIFQWPQIVPPANRVFGIAQFKVIGSCGIVHRLLLFVPEWIPAFSL
jgi:hypothetical protein